MTESLFPRQVARWIAGARLIPRPSITPSFCQRMTGCAPVDNKLLRRSPFTAFMHLRGLRPSAAQKIAMPPPPPLTAHTATAKPQSLERAGAVP